MDETRPTACPGGVSHSANALLEKQCPPSAMPAQQALHSVHLKLGGAPGGSHSNLYTQSSLVVSCRLINTFPKPLRLCPAPKPSNPSDPNLLDTLESYDGSPDFLRNIDMDKDALTKAIIGTMGDIDAYQLPDAKGYAAFSRYALHAAAGPGEDCGGCCCVLPIFMQGYHSPIDKTHWIACRCVLSMGLWYPCMKTGSARASIVLSSAGSAAVLCAERRMEHEQLGSCFHNLGWSTLITTCPERGVSRISMHTVMQTLCHPTHPPTSPPKHTLPLLCSLALA